MKVVQRLIQRIYADKWPMLEKMEKTWDAAESRLGFPPKTRYRYFSGGDGNIHIVEFNHTNIILELNLSMRIID